MNIFPNLYEIFLLIFLINVPLLFPSTEYGSEALVVMRNESFLLILKVHKHILFHLKEY